MTTPGSDWRPTTALVAAVAVPALLLPVALGLQRPALAVLAAPFAVAAVAGGRRPKHRPHLRASLADRAVAERRATSARVTLTDAGAVETVARTTSATPYLATRPPSGTVVRIVPPDEQASGRVSADVPISPRRWGQREVAAGQCAAVSVWSGFRWGPVPVPGARLLVLPEAVPFDSRAETPHPLGLVGVNRSRRRGEGAELAGIRAFAPGDRLRRIHWRSSLRVPPGHGLNVVATTAEEDSVVMLLVDATTDVGDPDPAGETPTSLDLGIRAAGALAEHHLRVGNRVGLRVFGARPTRISPATGSRHRLRILYALARVRPGPADDVDPGRVQLGLGEGGVVLVLSPMLSDALTTVVAGLSRRGLSVVVIDTLPDGVGRSDDEDPVAGQARRMWLLQRNLQLTHVVRTGTPVVRWSGPGSLDEVMRRLSRRERVPRVVSR